MSDYVPLSVEYGNRRKKLGWWFKGLREAVAVRLAPWLGRIAERERAKPEWIQPPRPKTFYLVGGPRDGQVIRSTSPVGKEVHYPDWESSGGRYVICTGTFSLGSFATATHVVYAWQEDS